MNHTPVLVPAFENGIVTVGCGAGQMVEDIALLKDTFIIARFCGKSRENLKKLVITNRRKGKDSGKMRTKGSDMGESVERMGRAR